MTEHLRAVAADLEKHLGLDRPPVQVTYLDAPPKGIPEHPGGAPSVCTFFAEGQVRPFYAAIPAHEACEVGAFVMGIAPQGELGTRLMSTIGMMQKEGYLAPGEEAKIPRNETPPKYVVYAPLGTVPVAPTSVLFFPKAKGAMLALEASGGPVPTNGRPMCALVPTLNHGAPVAMSMGCVGSRVYTQIGDDRLVVGVRGDALDAFHASLTRIVQANQAVGAEDQRRREASTHPFAR
jgi:uncharacterized protein (DUF169 family)